MCAVNTKSKFGAEIPVKISTDKASTNSRKGSFVS